MLPDRVSNPGPLTYESGALPIALRGPADQIWIIFSLCELLICAFAESRYIALKMTILGKLTDGLMNLLPW